MTDASKREKREEEKKRKRKGNPIKYTKVSNERFEDGFELNSIQFNRSNRNRVKTLYLAKTHIYRGSVGTLAC